jgi:formylglycine-generating enzyme required for sulfatase activity
MCFALVAYGCSGSVGHAPVVDDGFDASEHDAKSLPDAAPEIQPPPRPQSCVVPAEGADYSCGVGGDDDCCAVALLPGGWFYRDFDGRQFHDAKDRPAKISPVFMDKYLVTVGRFRRFVEAYPDSRPTPGQGAHPGVPETGWKLEFSIAPNQAELRSALLAGEDVCKARTWTDEPGVNEHLPINCVSWYELFAFCAWDGGRLPSFAESQFAALGGSQQRVFPWSVPASSEKIDPSNAVYSPLPVDNPLPGPEPVGSRPKGAGRWGHLDLGGNIAQVVLDQRAPIVGFCADCVLFDQGISYDVRLTRGGWYGGNHSLMYSIERLLVRADKRETINAARCVR